MRGRGRISCALKLIEECLSTEPLSSREAHSAMIVLAESIVKLSWLIDNNQCAVVIPLTSDLDIALGDMQDLGRRPSSSATCQT